MNPAVIFALLAFIAVSVWEAVAQPADLGFGPAASFEGILTQAEGTIEGQAGGEPSAVHRGALTLTITRRGAVSGRLRYNEILPAEGAGSPVYKPIVRSFSGALKPVGEATGRHALSVSLGTGVAAGRQRLVLEADYSGARPTVVARVNDSVSSNAGGGRGFQSQTPVLAAIEVGPLPEGALGRYVFNTEGAYVLLQVLPAGKVLWSTRMPRYANSGSALAVAGAAGFSCAFYEAKTFRVAGGSGVNSLLGTVRFLRPEIAAAPWQARAGDAFFPEALDWQSSLSPGLPNSTPQLAATAGGVASGAGAAAGSDVERGLLHFGPEDSGWWFPKEAASGIFQSGVNVSAPAVLVLRNAAFSDGAVGQVLHAWNVFFSGGGFRVEGVVTNGVLPPVLSLRLARDRGEISGFYVDAFSRRRGLKGAALSSLSAGFQAEGWVEPVDSDGAALLVWELRSGVALASPVAEVTAAASPAPTPVAPACQCSSQVQSAGALPAAAAAAAADTVSGGTAAASAVHDCLPPLIDPPPLIQPPMLILPPALFAPPELINPPALIDPPVLIQPPPLIDPPPLILPPELIAPPELINPPALIDPPALIQPPPLILPPDLIAPPPLC